MAHSTVERTMNNVGQAPSWRNRLWRYGPLGVWLALIFLASTGTFSAANTSRIIGPLLHWLLPNITEAQLMRAHFFTRKLAHFSEYALLALLAARAFIPSTKSWLRHRWLLSALLLVVAYALLDEYHQSFEATRTASIWDSLIDTIGGTTALALLAWWRRSARMKDEG